MGVGGLYAIDATNKPMSLADLKRDQKPVPITKMKLEKMGAIFYKKFTNTARFQNVNLNIAAEDLEPILLSKLAPPNLDHAAYPYGDY